MRILNPYGLNSGVGTPSAQAAFVSGAATGLLYPIGRLLTPTSTLSLVTGTNPNLKLSGSSISATAAIGAGLSQTAVVREALAQRAIEYPVTLTGK